MKTPTLVLIVSLAANGVLGGVVVWNHVFSGPDAGGRSRLETARGGASAGFAGEPGADDALAGVSGQGELARVWALFNAGDTEAFIAALRAAGMSEDLIRTLVREQISSRYRARIRAIEDAARGADRPYWQRSGRVALSAEQRAEIRDLQREMWSEMQKALGDDPTQAGSERYAYLSGDKAQLLSQIDTDYNDMMRQTRDGMRGFSLPSDREALRLLEEERRADIEAMLTPEELYAYDLRNSNAANRVQREFGSVIGSEEDYKAIYDLVAAWEKQYGSGGSEELDRRDRASAEAALRSEILDMLGPEAAAQYAQQRDPDYRVLEAAAARLNLPATATASVIDLRARAATTSQEIMSDSSLDAAARTAALQELAASVQSQLRETMGSEGGDAFAQQSSWLRALERGQSFTLNPEGGVSVGGSRGGGRGNGTGDGRRGIPGG